MAAKAPPKGITVVANESYGTTDTDMTPQLTKIQQTPAQALVVNCWRLCLGISRYCAMQ